MSEESEMITEPVPGTGDTEPSKEQKCEDLPENPNAIDISPNNDGAVLKEIVREGQGNEHPCAGDTVNVHYVGTLLDGTKFDSSRDREEEFTFQLGKGNVIKGWDIGVATMKKGELAVLTCKPEYAYGTAGSPPKIPGDATLKFEVELISWEGEDISKAKDGGIIRSSVKAGEGYSQPNDDAQVEVHLIGRFNGQVFDERDVRFILGEGDEIGIPCGVEQALKKFKKDERSLLKLKSAYGFGNKGNEHFNIPGNAELEYDVLLKSFEKARESWEMDSDEKIEQSQIKKEKGTKFFKEGKYDKAVKQYKKIIDYLESENAEGETAEKVKSLILAAHLNTSMCNLKLQKYAEAQKNCDKALEKDARNEKGLFRRGQALFAQKDYELAMKDFLVVLEVNPENKAAKNEATLCRQKIKAFHEKEKRIFGNMFEKFAKEDEKNQKNAPAPDIKTEEPSIELINHDELIKSGEGKKDLPKSFDPTDDIQMEEQEEEVEQTQQEQTNPEAVAE